MASKGDILVFSRRKSGFLEIATLLPGYTLTDAYADVTWREYGSEVLAALLKEEGPYDLAITTHQEPVLFLYDHGYEDKLLGLSAGLEGILLHNLLPDEVCKDAALLIRKVNTMIASYRNR